MWLLLVAVTPNALLMSVIWLCAILSVYFAATFRALLVYSLLYLELPKEQNCGYIRDVPIATEFRPYLVELRSRGGETFFWQSRYAD